MPTLEKMGSGSLIVMDCFRLARYTGVTGNLSLFEYQDALRQRRMMWKPQLTSVGNISVTVVSSFVSSFGSSVTILLLTIVVISFFLLIVFST